MTRNIFVGKGETYYVAREIPETDHSLEIRSEDLDVLAGKIKLEIGEAPWEIQVQSESVNLQPLNINDRARLLNIIDSHT